MEKKYSNYCDVLNERINYELQYSRLSTCRHIPTGNCTQKDTT